MPGAAWSLQVGSPYWDVQQFGRHNGANIKPVVSKKGLTQIKDVYEEYAKSGETFTLTDLFPFDVRTYYIIGQFESNANAMQELRKKIESKYNALKATPTMVKAQNEGNGTLAHFLLGYCFYKGLGTKQDNESSLRCFREGGSKGDFRCTVMMFALGLTSEKNSGDMELLSSAASQGYIPAKMIIAYLQSSNLPNRMFNVKNIKTDREIEVYYHSLLDSKYPEASYIWGKMRNSESPIKVAAYDGLSYAIKEIVAQYDETQNYEEAYKFVRVGERKGIEFDKTQYNRIKINALAKSEKAVDVANALREAYIMKEYEFIKKVYQDALARNVTSGDIVTYYVLASKKIGVKDKQDEKQYFNLIKDAAEDGCANAMFVLAESYEKGFGIESIDMNSAIMWYKKAAQGGSSNAQKYLKGRNLKW